MKTIFLQHGKKWLIGLLLVCLAVTVWTGRGVIKRVWDHLWEQTKDAGIVIANNSDPTMKDVMGEFEIFNKNGYRDNAYPALDQLYNSRKNWRYDSMANFCTSINMLSYGADQAISTGNWEKLTGLLDDAIAGYQQFVPLRQQTIAILYLKPCLNLAERTAKSETLTIPADVNQHLLAQMTQLKKILEKAPDESTNNFKQQALTSIDNTINALQKRQPFMR